MNGTEIKQGMRIQFIDTSGPDPIDGIVNGPPWVWWNGIDAEARIPVHVPSLNANIDVAGHNVFRVASEPPRMSTDFPGQPFGRGDTISTAPASLDVNRVRLYAPDTEPYPTTESA